MYAYPEESGSQWAIWTLATPPLNSPAAIRHSAILRRRRRLIQNLDRVGRATKPCYYYCLKVTLTQLRVVTAKEDERLPGIQSRRQNFTNHDSVITRDVG